MMVVPHSAVVGDFDRSSDSALGTDKRHAFLLITVRKVVREAISIAF